MQNRGILITLRAAAIVIIVTGLNDVIASAVPRYEPLYLYLAAVALVALTDGILLGIAAAALATAFYALLFMPRASALSPALVTPAAAAAGIAVLGAVIRGFVRSRRRKPVVPAIPVMPPLLETSTVAQMTDNAEVLAAIDELRNELRTAITDLNASRSRETELSDRTRNHVAEAAAMDLRIRQFEADREWALKVADESRTRADRERELRLLAENLLADAREESVTSTRRIAELEASLHKSEVLRRDLTALRSRVAELEGEITAERGSHDEARRESAGMAGRVAELELSLREKERLETDAAALRSRVAELEGEITSERASLDEARRESAAMAGRVAELELALREKDRLAVEAAGLRERVAQLEGEVASSREALADRERALRLESDTSLEEARKEAAGLVGRVAELELSLREREGMDRDLAALRAQIAELETALATERTAREHLETEAQNYDKKLQTIVTHLASDHEADLGQIISEKEEARAEARALSMKLAKLQQKYDEDAARLRDAETLLGETRAAAQREIDQLRAQVASADAPRAARPRVMIVHPDADLRAAASTTLERAGYDVVSAADGLEALRVAMAQQPDVVISETSMPRMDGRELCQLLKSQEKTAHIRVILLMRASDEVPRGDLPPDEILRKPVPVETLKATLANLLAP